MLHKDMWMKFVALMLIFPVMTLNAPFPLYAEAQRPVEIKSTKGEPPKLKEGKITGKVLKSDGKTVLSDISITVVDSKTGKIIATVKTDKDGRYALPALKPGKYRLVVAHRMVVEIEVVSQSEISLASLNFLLPEALLGPPAENNPGGGEQEVRWYATKTAVVSFMLLLGGTAVVFIGSGAVSPSVP